MARCYNYDTDKSIRVMDRIEKSLRKHEKSGGATQAMISSETDTSTPNVSRYLDRMMQDRRAHVAGKKGRAAVYKPGPLPDESTSSRKRVDPFHLPSGFFGVPK